LSNKLWFYCKK